MKTRHTCIAIAALMLASSATLAGLETSEPVSVDSEARTAEGDMATARARLAAAACPLVDSPPVLEKQRRVHRLLR